MIGLEYYALEQTIKVLRLAIARERENHAKYVAVLKNHVGLLQAQLSQKADMALRVHELERQNQELRNNLKEQL